MMDLPGPVEVFLRELDDAWEHPWESVRVALDGVEEDEAAWQHPSYAADPGAMAGEDGVWPEGWPPAGTVRWHVAHLAACKRDYACVIRDRGGPVDRSDAAFTPGDSLAADLAALQEAHAWLRREIAALTPAELERSVNESSSVGAFLPAVIRHDPWHAGQIAMVRRLYRTR